jgi:hypothetical protein
MATVEWDEAVGLWVDTPFLWHVVPGFAGTTHPLFFSESAGAGVFPLTIVRTTLPAAAPVGG